MNNNEISIKGLMVNVFRAGKGWATNGVSRTEDVLYVECDEGLELIVPEELVMVVCRKNFVDSPYVWLEPKNIRNHRWPMAGGNFAFSSDSRFSRCVNPYPVAIHDRVE